MVAISFITVTMNNRHTVKPLFDSFFETAGDALPYEYFVVDNCSTDGTAEFIKANYPGIKLVETGRIQGFAANNNVAIEQCSGRVIALINPDIVFLPNAVNNVLTYLQNHADVGMVGPLLLNADGSLQNSARRFLNPKLACLRLLTLGKDSVRIKPIQHYLTSYNPAVESQYVDWVIGAAMFVRREALESVGPLDTNYFLYIEDQDWCFQMWKKKWKIVYHTSSRLIHDHQRSSARKLSKKSLWHVQSILYFLRKNYLARA
ncbi:glycosyltransferase family 2 protein [Flavisolibacter ginsenosidimutans]|uniref:Glycosyltransferase family 2 protein n=1 Tax=Flavisolibacter ginsenosidimutans TaxID=661481 RepID=A0A5B8UL84_9BACT|nr:glycosyltransferase family 2 protein [Flavisolibacter ginsenosidimutans]QEC57323.1 glycosyltransferase family 2 protein [Flavisolibacter ginsenosidimutans]